MTQLTAASRLRRRSGLGPASAVAGVAAIALLIAVMLVLETPTGNRRPESQVPGAPRPFAPNSVWNAPTATDAPISPLSRTYVSELEQQIARFGSWISTTQYSVPVYTVGPDQRRVPVVLDAHGGSADVLGKQLLQGVPVPAGAQPAAGTDRHLVVWQPADDTMWEFWGTSKVDGRWHARWGGKMTDVSRSAGYFPRPADWGATATSLPLLGGLMRIGELRSGHIDHALAISIPRAAAHAVAFPAQRSDGIDPSPTAIPEGTRFRLDPRLNVNALHVPAITKAIALAAQRYGMIVRDQAGSVSLYAEDPRPTGTDAYAGPHGLFENQYPNNLLRGFPWNRLEVVKAPVMKR